MDAEAYFVCLKDPKLRWNLNFGVTPRANVFIIQVDRRHLITKKIPLKMPLTAVTGQNEDFDLFGILPKECHVSESR